MAQGLRDLMSNRRFAIPLIILLAVCLIGLLMLAIVLIFRPGAEEPVAEATELPTVEGTATVGPTDTPVSTDTATPRPTNTLVPVDMPTGSAGEDATATSAETTTPEPTSAAGGEATAEATAEATSGAGAGEDATATPQVEDEELAQTGIGWGLLVIAAAGLALLVFVARRLRLVG
jgi:cytoskeletal protein RodZ